MAATSISDLDLESLPDEDLRELSVRVRQAVQTRVRSRLEAYQQMAREAGLEVTIGKPGESDAIRRRGRPSLEGGEGERRMVAPKYRNPDNPSETWSGRGVPPKWLAEKIAAGGSREDFLIEKTTGF